MNGAELRAWRERLGLTREDASRAIGNALTRRESINAETVERLEGNRTFYGDPAPYVAAYRAALEAEEDRQRAQAEPVCPEGVDIATSADGTYTNIRHAGRVYADGSFEALATCDDHRVALRYLLDLADYRARQRAEGDRQRKLDAVRAAEEAAKAAGAALQEASQKADAAYLALAVARREAGL